MKITWKHLVGGAAATVVALTGLIGFAHTPRGRALRPLLFAVNRVAPGANRTAVAAVAAVSPTTPGATDGSCPLGYDKTMSMADIEAQRQRQVVSYRGSTPAPARPALGFSLGASTRADVQRWSEVHHVDCATPRGPAQIVCTQIVSEALPPAFGGLTISEGAFQFDQADRLVSVSLVRSTEDADLAVRLSDQIEQELSRQLGSSGQTQGQHQGDYLRAGPLRQLRTEHRFADYFASTSATHMGSGRFALTERFELLTTGS